MSFRIARLAGLSAVVTTSLATVAFAQLSAADIAALQERGRQEGWTFTVGPNPATKLSTHQLCGTVMPSDPSPDSTISAQLPLRINAQTLPSSWDWRTLTGCPPIRNQGGCGSCWAFSTIGSLECAIRIKDGIDVDLAEEWLVRCNQRGWDCDGGSFAHNYLLRNAAFPLGAATDPCGGNGAVLEIDYPYTATDGDCTCPSPHYYTITAWDHADSDVAAIKQAIMDYGPVSVTVHGGDAPFKAYTGGIFNACYSGSGTDHAVVLVGWDDNQGVGGVWFLRNSWGEAWGEDGYMRIQYGCNNVGRDVAYLVYPGRPGAVTERVSLGPDAVQASNASGMSSYPQPGLSADGRYIAFESPATNLVANDTNTLWDIFVRDRQTATTERVNVSSSGEQAVGGNSQGPVLSLDGRYVVFYSLAINLASDDTNGVGDVFIHDRQTHTTELVSRAAGIDGALGNGNSGRRSSDANIYGTLAVSSDGRYVAFVSAATNLVADDTNAVDDVFVRDRLNNAIERVSVDSAGVQVGAKCSYLAMSPDARYVAFSSSATNLVADDTNGLDDVFVRDCQAATTERASIAADGAQATGGASDMPAISADGRYVAFRSAATNLMAGDTNAKADIFLRDRQAGTTECVSIRTGGAIADNASYMPSLSADGRYVTFASSATNLIAADTNVKTDVFIRDRSAGVTMLGSVGRSWQRGTGSGSAGHSIGGAISAGGRYLVFASRAANLVTGDTNGLQDVFLHDCGQYQGLGPIIDQAAVTVPENGTASFQVRLSRQPVADRIVVVAPASGSPGIAVQSGASLTFSTANWNTYQTVTLVSAADSDTCSDATTIRCAIADGEFADIIATQQDADSVIIMPSEATVAIAEGGVAAFQVKLNRQPCAGVLVTVAVAGGSAITTVQSGASLFFTTSNWDTYQTVTLASAVDLNAHDDQTTIRCSAPGLASTDVIVIQQDTSAADFDADGDVDLDDFGYLQACLTDAGIIQVEATCSNADLDCSGWVDQSDVGLFIGYFNGPNQPPRIP